MKDPAQLRILSVMDDQPGSTPVREALSAIGEVVETRLAACLMTALEMAAAEVFDGVILDLSLPDSRGFSTFEKFRHQFPGLPVVVLANLNNEEVALRAVREGAQDYLVKSAAKPATVLRSLRFAIERHRAMGSARRGVGGGEQGRTIGFMGVKGGSGATTVALNVAAALALQGKSVAAVELSPYCAGFSQQLRVSPRRDLADLLRLETDSIGAGPVRNCLAQPDFNVSLLFAPQEPPASPDLDPERVAAVLRAAALCCPYVIADFASVPSAAHRICARMCDPFVLVMDRDAAGLAAAKSAASLLYAWGLGRNTLAAVLVTRDAMSACVQPAQVRSDLGFPVAGVIPPAAEILAAARRQGSPLVTAERESLPADSLIRLAGRLSSAVVAEVAD
jgi:DNA-binding response OmpR family regulator